MFWLKVCPKCRGDMYRHSDVYGPYVACLQCGHYLTEAERAVLQRTSASIAPQPTAPAQVGELAA